MPRRTPTRDLFVRACEAISVSRSLGDFKYAPSLNHMTRRRSEWTDLIYFQSSHYNVQDLSVKLRVGVNVRDEVLKRWRVRTNASARQDGAVAAAYLGYLGEPSVYLDWDIAGDGFAPAVTEICQRLERDALAFFGLFTNLPRLNDLAIHVWLRHVLEPANTIELFLAHDLRQEIPRYIDLLQSSRAPVLDAARQRLLDPESITGVEARSRGGSGLAAVLRAHGLTDLLIEGAN